MGKFPTFPVIYDEVLTLSVSDLKKFGYLKNNQLRSGKLFWHRNGEEIASILIQINTIIDVSNLELKYIHNDNSKNYKILLVTIPSNLGIGQIHYFKCPITKKRCRKLYLVNGYFSHRDAFNGMYKKQTESKSWRKMRKVFENFFELDNLYDQIYSKHFRTHYAGIPTKRYLRLVKKIEKYEDINMDM